MKVDINLLKQLREETAAPFSDCKDALMEAEGDLDKANEILKEKGALKAAKKSDRETKEGLVKAISENDKVYAIKLACETDFVAKNDDFKILMDDIIQLLKSYEGEIDNLGELDADFLENTINALVTEKVGKIGENMKLADAFIKSGKSYIYTHPGDKVLAIVFYESENNDAESIAKELALQIAAMNPEYSNSQEIPQQEIEKLKQQFKEDLEGSNKPEEIIEKIVQGRTQKYFTEIVLMEQVYIRDEKKKIKEIIPEDFTLMSFKRFSI